AIARSTSEILDGSTFENTLKRLQRFINEHLGLDQIEAAVEAADLEKLDKWLRSRLSAFLDEELHLDKLAEIREAIHKLSGKRKEFYDAALNALTQTYKFKFNATYQKNTTRNALLDIEFDFTHGGVGDLLKAAIDGNFDEILIRRHEGVSLNLATLSHQID